jgi:hypothetical protein
MLRRGSDRRGLDREPDPFTPLASVSHVQQSDALRGHDPQRELRPDGRPLHSGLDHQLVHCGRSQHVVKQD